MNYIDKLKAVETIEDLYNLREELTDIIEAKKSMKEWDQAIFYKLKIETQIEFLEKAGIFLNKVGKEVNPASAATNPTTP
jgi:predicted RNA-binding protein with EMAP domain